jgi:hypothetical protein
VFTKAVMMDKVRGSVSRIISNDKPSTPCALVVICIIILETIASFTVTQTKQ